MYIISGKSVTGPNPGHLASSTASITSITLPGRQRARPRPPRERRTSTNSSWNGLPWSALPCRTRRHLRDLTERVAKNNFYSTETDEEDAKVMQFLSKRIKHVIYVVKENRTFDQVLGDLTNGANADPTLTQFGQALTPNNHSLATQFVTLDNFMNPGDGSMDGWSWAMQGRVTNTESLTQQINYAAVNRGLSYESEGANRNVPVNFATVAERDAAAGPAGTTNYSNASASLPGGTANLLAGAAQPRVRRRAVRHRGWLYLQRGAAGWRNRPQLRLPGEQHRQHRHEGRAGHPIRSRPASFRSRPSTRRWPR